MFRSVRSIRLWQWGQSAAFTCGEILMVREQPEHSTWRPLMWCLRRPPPIDGAPAMRLPGLADRISSRLSTPRMGRRRSGKRPAFWNGVTE